MTSPFAVWADRQEPTTEAPPGTDTGGVAATTTTTGMTSSNRVNTGQSGSAHTATTMAFMRMCRLFEGILSAVNKAQQYNYLNAFWKSLPMGQSFFPYMRLLLPHLDSVRPLYHLRESKLARLYVDVLGLSHRSPDAQRLLHWKDPSKNTVETTCFSDVIYVVLQHKGGFQRRNQAHQGEGASSASARGQEKGSGGAEDSRPPAFLTVDGVNSALDNLAHAESSTARVNVLIDLLQRSSPLEQKWLLRIILKDMKFRMTHQSILFAFHPSALDKYNSTSDLLYVCDSCVEEMLRPVPGSNISGIFLFQPIRPMLASPVTAKKLEQLLETEKVYSEPKYDGERIMIHIDAEQVMYWTRNAKNFSALYGPKFDSVARQCFQVGKTVTVPGVRHDSFDGPVPLQNVILDGEFLIYDSDTGTFVEFGMNRTFATAGEAYLSAGGDVDGKTRWFCYMIFDIVFLNGVSLMNLSLKTRRAILSQILVRQDKRAEMVPTHRVHSTADILSSLEKAIDNKMEGIVLKMGDAPYVPAERKHRWVKVKPDHIAGLADSMDLVVVGGYYGTKFGVRHISHFLLAAWAPGSSASPKDEGAMFHTVCKIGNGYTSEELNIIQGMLDPFWETMPNRQTIPPWLDGWKPVASDLTPDMYVHPRNSVILEVFGYSFTDSLNYRVGYTLRFPRMLRIRTDKSLEDATDLATLEKIKEASKDALKRRCADGKDELVTVMSLKWKRRREDGAAAAAAAKAQHDTHLHGGQLVAWSAARNHHGALPPRTIAVVTEQLGVPTLNSSEDVIDDLFAGYEFAVLFTSPETCTRNAAVTGNKTALETCMLRHGARVVANPGRNTSLLFASSATAPKVANWVQLCRTRPEHVAGRYAAADVAHCDWVWACVEAGTILPLSPRYVIYCSPTLSEKFKMLLDPYEDSYYEPGTVDSLRHSVQLARRRLEADAAGATIKLEGEEEQEPQPTPRSISEVSRSLYTMKEELGLLGPRAKRLVAGRRPHGAAAQAPLPGDHSPLSAVAQFLISSSPHVQLLKRVERDRALLLAPPIIHHKKKKGGVTVKEEPQLENESRGRETGAEPTADVSDYLVVEDAAQWQDHQLIEILKSVMLDGSCVVSRLADATHIVNEVGDIIKVV